MKITLLNTWKTNIGNGFIDKGAKIILESAFPESEITEVSGYQLHVSNSLQSLRDLISGNQSNLSGSKGLEPFSIAELINTDLAVLPGCTLTEHILETYSPVLDMFAEKDIPILFLGAGSSDFSLGSQNIVEDILDEFPNIGMISRNPDVFDMYSDSFDSSKKGIDCAFFINDWYSPPSSTESFIASTFDKTEEVDTDFPERVIRPNHTPFGIPHRSTKFQSRIISISDEFSNGDNTFISDRLKDYLFIYANASKTYSDRIHACVPALAYGNQAKFCYDSKRVNLFDMVSEKSIEDDLISISKESLKNEKAKQIKYTKEIVDGLV